MPDEFKGGDGESWRWQGQEGNAERINGIIKELRGFTAEKYLNIDVLNEILEKTETWALEYKNGPPEVWQLLDRELLKAEIYLAPLYLQAFNEIEHPSEEMARRAMRLVRFLEAGSNIEIAAISSSPDRINALSMEMLRTEMTVDELYPEVLDDIQTEEGDGKE